jgi:tetratricopeptide (TPR) repeat protein
LVVSVLFQKRNGSAKPSRAHWHLFVAVKAERVFASAILIIFVAVRLAAAQLCSSTSAAGPSQQLRVAECLMNRRQWNDALKAILQYRKSHPDSIDAAILQGQILIEMNLLADAQDVVKELTAIHPRSVEVLTFYADLCQKLGEFQQAERLLMQATEFSPDDPRVWKILGNFYLERGDRKAVETFRKAVQLRPQDPELVADYALALDHDGQPSEALCQFEWAEKLNRSAHPRSLLVALRFATFLRGTEKYRQSIPYYSAVLRADPNFVAVRLERAQSFIGILDWKSAEDDLRICAEGISTRAQALPLLLRTLQAQKKTEQAQQLAAQIERWSDQDLSNKATNNEIAADLRNAQALYTAGKLSEAAVLYRQLLARHPEATAGWSGLGLCEVKLNNPSAAETDFRRFLATNENSPLVHFYLGNVLLQEKEAENARAEFSRVIELDPLYVPAQTGIAASFITERNYNAAIQELRSIPSPASNELSVSLMLAEALYKGKNKTAALYELNLILKRDPTNGDALRMQKAISTAGVTDE